MIIRYVKMIMSDAYAYVIKILLTSECYGASYQDASNWVCDRCSLGDFTDVRVLFVHLNNLLI